MVQTRGFRSGKSSRARSRVQRRRSTRHSTFRRKVKKGRRRGTKKRRWQRGGNRFTNYLSSIFKKGVTNERTVSPPSTTKSPTSTLSRMSQPSLQEKYEKAQSEASDAYNAFWGKGTHVVGTSAEREEALKDEFPDLHKDMKNKKERRDELERQLYS